MRSAVKRVHLQADFPTVIGVTVDREDGSTPMETDGDKGKQGGTTYYIDTNQLRVPRESMEVMSPLKNGMSRWLSVIAVHFYGCRQRKFRQKYLIHFHLIVTKDIFGDLAKMFHNLYFS